MGPVEQQLGSSVTTLPTAADPKDAFSWPPLHGGQATWSLFLFSTTYLELVDRSPGGCAEAPSGGSRRPSEP